VRANFGETWANYNRPINLFAVDAPTNGDWTATLGVSSYLPAPINWNRIAIVAWDDTDNVASLFYGYSDGLYCGAYAENAQQMSGEGETRSMGSGPYLLRLVKDSNQYSAWWSTNGIDFQQGGKTVTYGNGKPAKIGFWFGTDQTQTNIALIDFFEVAKLVAPPLRLMAGASAGKLGFKWTALSSIAYQVEVSTDLKSWSAAGSPVTGQSGTVSYTAPMTNPGAYYRLRTQ
jgi:hypothetical protein